MTSNIRERDEFYTRLDELHEVEEWIPPRLSTADHLAVDEDEVESDQIVATLKGAQEHFVALDGFLCAMRVDPMRRRVLAASGMQKNPRDVLDVALWQLLDAFIDQPGLSDATFVRDGRRYFVEANGDCAAGCACVFAFDEARSTYVLARRAVHAFMTR